jgi:hypothetical protein
MGLGSGITDPEVKKVPDPGSGSATLYLLSINSCAELLNMKKLTDLYEGLELNETTYLGNALNMTMFGTNYAFSKLREQVTQINNRLHSYLLPSSP